LPRWHCNTCIELVAVVTGNSGVAAAAVVVVVVVVIVAVAVIVADVPDSIHGVLGRDRKQHCHKDYSISKNAFDLLQERELFVVVVADVVVVVVVDVHVVR